MVGVLRAGFKFPVPSREAGRVLFSGPAIFPPPRFLKIPHLVVALRAAAPALLTMAPPPPPPLQLLPSAAIVTESKASDRDGGRTERNVALVSRRCFAAQCNNNISDPQGGTSGHGKACVETSFYVLLAGAPLLYKVFQPLAYYVSQLYVLIPPSVLLGHPLCGAKFSLAEFSKLKARNVALPVIRTQCICPAAS